MAEMRLVYDGDMGVVAAAIDEHGEIATTAVACRREGMYIAIDESALYAATGELLPYLTNDLD